MISAISSFISSRISPMSKASTREASHAGSWYSAQRQTLNNELEGWLENVSPDADLGYSPPIQGCKAVIAPHAGYSYSGPAAAWAYKSIDTTPIKRVFILGPSHHIYLDGCALSNCKTYETPIGDLPLDLDTIQELQTTGRFSTMSLGVDEDEHSIEMHLPYVRKVFENKDISIVPILVGAINQDSEAAFGELLAPYLAQEDTFFVISSDFCHWGTRFSYTYYYPEPPPSTTPAVRLSKNGPQPTTLSTHPIHESISALDHEAMDILTVPEKSSAEEVHDKFAMYLGRTHNTICGRHPIGVLLGALATLKQGERHEPRIKWVRYEQSSHCKTVYDSSVSYASAFVTL